MAACADSGRPRVADRPMAAAANSFLFILCIPRGFLFLIHNVLLAAERSCSESILEQLCGGNILPHRRMRGVVMGRSFAIRQLPRRRDSGALSLHRTARNRLNTGMTCPLSEPDMRPQLPLSPSILALCFGLFAMTAQAEPTVHIRLDGQPLQPSWEMLGDDRFAAELD